MRKTALMVVPALAIASAGCSGGAVTPGSTAAPQSTVEDTTAPGSGPASSAASTSGAAATPSTSATAPAPPPTPSGLPTTFSDVDKTIKDPDLGQEIVVTKIARNLPWPAGYKASAEAYELVAVEMKWTPSTTYTAPIRLQDFSVNTGSQFPNRPDDLVNPTLQAATWALLPAEVPTGQSVTGWVVFKVDPKGAPKMLLDYTRPTSQVTNSGRIFPSQVFSAPLVG